MLQIKICTQWFDNYCINLSLYIKFVTAWSHPYFMVYKGRERVSVSDITSNHNNMSRINNHWNNNIRV